MHASYLHQTLGVDGAFEFLRELAARNTTASPANDLLESMAQVGIADPQYLLEELLTANVLQRLGERIGLSTLGMRSLLLLEAVNGADVREVYRRLTQYDSTLRMYELVREGMTWQFLRSINDRPGFARLYICSPWIALSDHQSQLLVHAIIQEEGRGGRPEVFVVTRPDTADLPTGALDVFRKVHAEIYFHPRLHTKLYIREPGPSGGIPMAIIGSQNLTRSQYLELGIKVNADAVMVDQLISYFWDVCNVSDED